MSYIEEFAGKYEKNSDLVVAICGPSGAGKGTLAEHVAERLGVETLSAGDFFREMACENGMTVEEFSEKADKEDDIEVDRRTLEKALSEDCVVESRIAAWVLGDHADLKIYVTADLEERARRVKRDLENRKNEEPGELEEVKDRIGKRDRDNRQRYLDYYSIDMEDTSIFDVLIDNTDMSIEEQEEHVDKILRKNFPGRLQ